MWHDKRRQLVCFCFCLTFLRYPHSSVCSIEENSSHAFYEHVVFEIEEFTRIKNSLG